MKISDPKDSGESHFQQYRTEYIPLKLAGLASIENAIIAAVQANFELKEAINNEAETLRIAKASKTSATIANFIAGLAFLVAALAYFKPH